MSGPDPHGWNQQRASIIANQQAAQHRSEQDQAAGGFLLAQQAATANTGSVSTPNPAPFSAIAYCRSTGHYAICWQAISFAGAEFLVRRDMPDPPTHFIVRENVRYLALATNSRRDCGMAASRFKSWARRKACEVCPSAEGEQPAVIVLIDTQQKCRLI